MIKNLFLLIMLAIAGNLSAQNLASWSQVGPIKFPENPSIQTTGMGRVSQLVYHPTDSNIVYAVSASGGLYMSSNEGASWKPMTDFFPQTPCASLAINPLNPKVMYLGTGDANYYAGGLGVWKSVDGGKSWFQWTNGIGNKLVVKLVFSPTDTATLLAACSDGVYKTSNSGGLWQLKTTVTANYRDLQFRQMSNNIVYAAAGMNFYISYNTGETWTERAVTNNYTNGAFYFGLTPADTSLIYCVMWRTPASKNSFLALFKSNNGGLTFTLQSDSPNILGYSGDGSSQDGQGYYNLCIAVDPVNPNVLYIGAINVWKSLDAGQTWILKSPWGYGVHADKHNFLFSPWNRNKLYLCHDGGLDRTLDGGDTWTTLEDGLTASEFYKLGNSKFDKDALIGGLQDNGLATTFKKVFYTIRGGDYFQDFYPDNYDSTKMYFEGGGRYFIYNNSSVYDNGLGVYTFHPSDTNTMFYHTTNVYRTTNARANPGNTVNWSQITNNLGGNNSGNIDAVAFPEKAKGTFYVYKYPELYRCNNINVTTPAFTMVYNSNLFYRFKQLETTTADTNVLYATTTNSRILKSSDRGVTWTDLTKNLPAIGFIKFIIDQKATDSSMYMCTPLGIYYRNRFMINWISFNQGLPTIARITDMEIISNGTSNSRLQISTYGRGIWQTDLYKSSAIKPTADFVINPLSSSKCSDVFMLTDQSTGGAYTKIWNISPATGWTFFNGTDSLSRRAEIKFTNPGNYYITQKVANAVGSDFKTIPFAFVQPQVLPACYTTTNTLGFYSIGIYRFEFKDIDNISQYTLRQTQSTEDFFCKHNSRVRPGGSYTAWVTNGTSYNENCRIYIDYHNNGNFTDPGELVGTISSGMGRRSCVINIPSNPAQTNKFLRMRIVSDNSPVTDPCGPLSYGQSEDYSIYIDNVKPTVTIQIPKPTVSNSFTARFTLSELVDGFEANDINLTNGTLSNFKMLDAFTYTATITPIANGTVSILVNANSFSDKAGNFNQFVTDATNAFVGISTYTFSGISISDTIIQSPMGGRILSKVPFGTNTDSLIATFSLSLASNARVLLVQQYSGVTKNNFKDSVFYSVISSDSSIVRNYVVIVETAKNIQCQLLSFGFNSPLAIGVISQIPTIGSVAITVPYGTNLNGLISQFTLSDSARLSLNGVTQISNVTPNNYTNPLLFKVTAQDTNFFKLYQVNVRYGLNPACEILNFSLVSPLVSGTITPTPNGGTIVVKVPFGTAIQNLVPTFVVSDSAKVFVSGILQVSGNSSHNFINAITYKVVAQDTNFSKTYLVSVEVLPNKECNLISYGFSNPLSTGSIIVLSGGGIVNISVPFPTNLSALVANFQLSDSAKAYILAVNQLSGISSNDFMDTVSYTIVAQDTAYRKIYKVVVQRLPNSDCDLLSFGFANPLSAGTIVSNSGGGSVSISVPSGTDLSNLKAVFTVSDSAISMINGIIQWSGITVNSFVSPQVYRVVAQNGISSKLYTVSVSVKAGLGKTKANPNGIVTVVPNPANSKFRIYYSNTIKENSIAQFTDATGRVLEVFQVSSATPTEVETLKFAAGIYYLYCEGEVVRMVIAH